MLVCQCYCNKLSPFQRLKIVIKSLSLEGQRTGQGAGESDVFWRLPTPLCLQLLHQPSDVSHSELNAHQHLGARPQDSSCLSLERTLVTVYQTSQDNCPIPKSLTMSVLLTVQRLRIGMRCPSHWALFSRPQPLKVVREPEHCLL